MVFLYNETFSVAVVSVSYYLYKLELCTIKLSSVRPQWFLTKLDFKKKVLLIFSKYTFLNAGMICDENANFQIIA